MSLALKIKIDENDEMSNLAETRRNFVVVCLLFSAKDGVAPSVRDVFG